MSATALPPRSAQRVGELRALLAPELETLGVGAAQAEAAFAAGDYFALLEAIIPNRPGAPPGPLAKALAALEELLRIKAFSHPAQTGALPLVPVVFGTGGHRGEIGRGLTLLHVKAIVEALMAGLEAMIPQERERNFGARELAEVKRRGIVIGHDNRLLNRDFAAYTAHLLAAQGYRVAYAGRAASPEMSLVTPLEGWAGAINFTPSHNPFRYGGIKFNPADGGLAAAEMTDPLAAEANRLLAAAAPEDWPDYEALDAMVAEQAGRTEPVDVHQPYLEALARHPVIRLRELAAELRALPPAERVHFVADPVWGAAVPVYQRLQEMLGPEVMSLLHTEDDYYFGGQTTEPDEHTVAEAVERARATPARFKVVIRNDPDGDRGLVGDERGGIKMNRYAALVMKYLLELGHEGGLATTLATSHFGPAFARAHGREVMLTAVGFKNFRPLLADGRALVAYEESDGLSIAGHTLDKDGVLAGLLALRIVLHYRRPLSALVEEIEAEVGRYHWHQENFPVHLSAAEARVKLQRLAEVQPGQELGQGAQRRRVAAVNTEDGYKFEFEDGTWLMMRPSGTEPKVRCYAETTESPEASRALAELGKALALGAVNAP